ncbi:hypothetical protein Tco_1303466 [Tanacetum coccineum]
MKGALFQFRKRRKLSPRYIWPFKIVARMGPVAYTLELPKELKGIHNTFHVLNLKKCLAEGDVVVPMEEIQLDNKLHMIEEPVEIVDKEVMAAPTILFSTEENLRDSIDIRVDIIYPKPVASVAFLAAAIVRTQAQHGEAIRGIQEHLLGVPTQEELTALRFRVDIAKAENASLRTMIKITEAIDKITRNRERQVRIKMEQQLAAVQESQRQDREDFRKLKELVNSQLDQTHIDHHASQYFVLACLGDL